jgi:hypothetical protein
MCNVQYCKSIDWTHKISGSGCRGGGADPALMLVRLGSYKTLWTKVSPTMFCISMDWTHKISGSGCRGGGRGADPALMLGELGSCKTLWTKVCKQSKRFWSGWGGGAYQSSWFRYEVPQGGFSCFFGPQIKMKLISERPNKNIGNRGTERNCRTPYNCVYRIWL